MTISPKFIVLNVSGAAYQEGAKTKNGKNPSSFIGNAKLWRYATKFNSVDEAIEKIKSEGFMKKYRVVSYENPTRIFAQNGEKKEFSQLLPFSVYSK